MEHNQIAPFLQDLGYGATFNSNIILAVLEQLQIYPSNALSRITPQEIGGVLAMMAKTHSQLNDNPTLRTLTAGLLDDSSQSLLDQMQTWNLELFFPMMKKMVLQFNHLLRCWAFVSGVALINAVTDRYFTLNPWPKNLIVLTIIRILILIGRRCSCAWITLIPLFTTLIL